MELNGEHDWSGLAIIEHDPEKMGGAPTVRGRRITPDTYVDYFNDGFSDQEIATEYFSEPIEDVRIVLNYAQEHGWLSRTID